MSGVGKSHASRCLAARGFDWHDCDLAIAERLSAIVEPAEGEAPVHALGRWMGMPWTEGYPAREARYLALEAEVTRSKLAAARDGRGPQVVDTTGSVIYLDHALLGELRASTTVVFLDAGPAGRDRLLELYRTEPKPVVWAGAFAARPGEARPAALARCYADLLARRERRYRALAHVVVSADALRAGDPAEVLLAAVDRP